MKKMIRIETLPLDGAMSDLDRPTGQAVGLPGKVYSDPACWDAERERLFRDDWFAVCCATDVPKPGDLLPLTIAGWELLLARGADGELRCFHNICRHRGTKLVRERRNARNIVCGWHCWTYALDGSLQSTPLIDGPRTALHEDFDRRQLGLVEVRTAIWNDAVFVNLSGNARPFQAFSSAFTRLFERYFPGDFDYSHPEVGPEVMLQINWKLYHEGGLEGYHLPFVHPALEQPDRYQVDHDDETFTSLTGWLSRYRRLGTIVGLAEDTLAFNRAAAAAASTGEKLPYTICFITPTLIFSVWPEAVVSTFLRPISPTQTGVRRNFYFIGKGATAPGALAARRKYNEIWEGVTREDMDYSEGVQLLSGQRDEVGVATRFSPYWEEGVRLFQKRVAQRAYGPLG